MTQWHDTESLFYFYLLQMLNIWIQ